MNILTNNTTFKILLLIAYMSLLSCSGKQPSDLGIKNFRLTPCPSTSNCVSSDAEDSTHKIAPLQLILPSDKAWQATKQAVLQLPRTVIIKENPDYLHAECSSAVFGFVDDLELHLRVADNYIAVRSASRLGDSDFGVNRNRVEALRSSLQQQGVIR